MRLADGLCDLAYRLRLC